MSPLADGQVLTHSTGRLTEFSVMMHGIESPTTLMIRNLPRRFTAWDLVAELELYMRRSAFNFVYVPWDRKNSNNMGYAFVNFTETNSAALAYSSMEGQEWRLGARARLMKLVPAHVQGLAQNLGRYAEQGEAPDAGHFPLVFLDGSPVLLEEALRRHSAAAAASPRGPWSRMELSVACSKDSCGATEASSASGHAQREPGPMASMFGSSSSGVTSASAATTASECLRTQDTSSSSEDPVESDHGGRAGQRQSHHPAYAMPSSPSARPPPSSRAAAPGLPPPLGLEDVAHNVLRESPEYAASWYRVNSLLKKLIERQNARRGETGRA